MNLFMVHVFMVQSRYLYILKNDSIFHIISIFHIHTNKTGRTENPQADPIDNHRDEFPLFFCLLDLKCAQIFIYSGHLRPVGLIREPFKRSYYLFYLTFIY